LRFGSEVKDTSSMNDHDRAVRYRRLALGHRGEKSAMEMAMEFSRIIGPVEDMEIWNASSAGFSFVISYESRSGPGFHGHTGFVASWRPIDQNKGAIKIGGSPFKTFAEAEEACKAMLGYLTNEIE
jgi:hypothetical protein